MIWAFSQWHFKGKEFTQNDSIFIYSQSCWPKPVCMLTCCSFPIHSEEAQHKSSAYDLFQISWSHMIVRVKKRLKVKSLFIYYLLFMCLIREVFPQCLIYIWRLYFYMQTLRMKVFPFCIKTRPESKWVSVKRLRLHKLSLCT